MIVILLLALSFLAFISSTYVSIACFCIIHRMTKRTPWSLAIAIIAIASLSAFGFLESIIFIAGKAPYVHPVLAVATVITALVFLRLPRINTERRPHHG